MAAAFSSSEYKVIIIGGLGVGKTSLLLRYIHDTFEDRVSKFVAEEKKTVVVNGVEVVLDIWDTAGQERFQSITNRFYCDSQAVVIVYDVMGEETIQDLDFWVREVNYYLLRELENGLPVLFVGNKKDLLTNDSMTHHDSCHRPEDVSTNPGGVALRQVQELCNLNGFLRPFECSAKTGENVQKIFNTIAFELVKRKMPANQKRTDSQHPENGGCTC